MNKGDKTYEIHGRTFILSRRDYRWELFYGLMSGYSRCCIEAYIKRHLVMLYKNENDPESARFKEIWQKIKAEEQADEFRKRFDHILCPECLAQYRAMNLTPKYFYC